MSVRMGIATTAVIAACGTASVVVAQRARIGEAWKVRQECTLKVEDMVCGACANRVQTVARNVDGVRDATVSHERGTAQITYDPAKTNPTAIAKAISENAGFKSEVKQ